MRRIPVELALWLGAGVSLAILMLIGIYVGAIPPVFGLLVLFAGALAVFRALRDQAAHVLLVFVSVFLASIILGSPLPRLTSEGHRSEALRRSWPETADLDDSLPVFFHLVFDEMMSPGAIDPEFPFGAATRQALYALGERFGLRTLDSVYSRSFFSGTSLPNLFDAEWRGKTRPPERSTEQTGTVGQNAYFLDMARRGYRTIVFQTSHLNFCANEQVERCETFPSFDPGVLDGSGLGPHSRALHLANILLRSYEPSYVSSYGQRLLSSRTLDRVDPRKFGTGDRFDVQGFPGWFRHFIDFAGRAPRGTHVFAHFMVPHGPYLLRPDCLIGQNHGVGYYLGARTPEGAAREAARELHYRNYFRQLDCVRSQIHAFLEAVDGNPAHHDARIIIHGDHGSRISVGNVIEEYEDVDYVANYGTYFAVRGPGVKPGMDCEFLSLPEAFRLYASGAEPLPPLEEANPPLLVKSRAGENLMVEAAMAPFGCAVEAAVPDRQ